MLQITKIYNSICVFATKNLYGTQSYNAEKSPADSLCGGLLYYIIYPALLLRMCYEINQCDDAVTVAPITMLFIITMVPTPAATPSTPARAIGIHMAGDWPYFAPMYQL